MVRAHRRGIPDRPASRVVATPTLNLHEQYGRPAFRSRARSFARKS
jgi:hypothetical protein